MFLCSAPHVLLKRNDFFERKKLVLYSCSHDLILIWLISDGEESSLLESSLRSRVEGLLLVVVVDTHVKIQHVTCCSFSKPF